MINTKPFRISLKLKEGKSPHLYISQIKALMEDDTSLHPMMEKTLKLLKKTNTPFIRLSQLREIVIDGMNLRHFDRSADPKGSWVCTFWGEDEVKQYKANPEEHLKNMFKMFEGLGYEFYNKTEISLDYMKMLEDLTSKQIEAQLSQMEKEE